MTISHRDVTGRVIKLNDVVAYGDSSRYSGVSLSVITKINLKTVRGGSSQVIPPSSCVIINDFLEESINGLRNEAKQYLDNTQPKHKTKLTYEIYIKRDRAEGSPYFVCVDVLEDGRNTTILGPSKRGWALTYIGKTPKKGVRHGFPCTEWVDDPKVYRHFHKKCRKLPARFIKRFIGYVPTHSFVLMEYPDKDSCIADLKSKGVTNLDIL